MIRSTRSLAVLVWLSLFAGPLAAQLAPPSKPDSSLMKSGQLLVVVSPGWDNFSGRLYCFEKNKNRWELAFSNEVVLGKSGLGLAAGISQLPINGVPLKQEGDGRSPAGIFAMGPAFGYADYKDAGWMKVPYIRATDTLICVDDAHSTKYNQLIGKNDPQKDWKSHEEMHRADDFYKWGLFVAYNNQPAMAAKGSCIFLHIWENNQQGTEGCTAMPEKDILQVLHWIDARQRPLLLQLPAETYGLLAASCGWPSLP